MKYTYYRSSDGTEEAFDILTPDGMHLATIPFWYEADKAEADAKLICNALNAYESTNLRG